MRDKRSVDDIPLDELERILVIRRREERQALLRSYERQGRRVPAIETPPRPEPLPQQHEAAHDIAPVAPPVTYDITDEVPHFEDEEPDQEIEILRPKKAKQPPTVSHAPTGPRQRAGWDRLLLVVEVVGVLGIVGVLAFGGYLLITENNKIEALDQKSAAIQQEADALRPTATPAPELRVSLSDYVLPGGHYSPDQTGGEGAFNLDELPASIRPAAMAQITAPQASIATPQPISPVQIEIPAISVNASIYGGDDWYALQKGVGHWAGSANPGEHGNMVLTAHNDIYGELFRYLENLEPGDEVRVMANNRKWYTYVVREKQVVKPSDTWVMAQGNESIVTLITCYPYRVDNRRMVVFAELRDQ